MGVSAELLHLLGLSWGGAEDPSGPGGLGGLLQGRLVHMAPSEGLATPSRDRCPAARAPLRQAGRQPLLRAPCRLFVPHIERIQLGKCLQPVATEEKAFITLQPAAVMTAWIDSL